MNSMASNIQGYTVHSWGEIEFMKDGCYIANKKGAMGCDLSSMATKCENLRFVLIDEIENVDAAMLGDLDQHTFGGVQAGRL